jgi:hypothetical protein
MTNGSAKTNETFGFNADADVSGSSFHVPGGNWAVNIFTVLENDQMQYLNTGCIDPALAPHFRAVNGARVLDEAQVPDEARARRTPTHLVAPRPPRRQRPPNPGLPRRAPTSRASAASPRSQLYPIFYSPDHLLHNATSTETSMHAGLHPGRFTS